MSPSTTRPWRASTTPAPPLSRPDRIPQVYRLPSNLSIALTDESGRRASGPVALARGLASSPVWEEMDDAILVVRTGPKPLVAIFGYFDTNHQTKLAALNWQLEHVLPRLRYVNYRQSERAAARLAAQLLARFGHKQVKQFRYLALPRGGYFVLGMLAYALDIRRDRLEFPHHVSEPLVVVDDCALTGLRFRHFLKKCPSSQIIFAPLCSHPDLRTAIRAHEPRVIACLSPQDLHDFAPKQLGSAYAAWRERWLTRSPDAYWVGLTDHVCFPWSEPDVGIWNPQTGREEAGWRLVPPELCLKNRRTPRRLPSRLQFQPLGPGPLRAAPHVLFGELRSQVVVANVATQESFALAGVAADMWTSIATLGDAAEVLVSMKQKYDVEEERLAKDLEQFVGNLLERGLLEMGKV